MSVSLTIADEVARTHAVACARNGRLNPDVILTGATSGVSAEYNATRTIPIVTIRPTIRLQEGLRRASQGLVQT